MSVGELVDRAERPAYVSFERRSVEDKAATLREGKYVGRDVDFALVTPPYSKDCVEYKVDTWLQNIERNLRDGRIPQSWADAWKEAHKRWVNGQELPLNGTPIKGWGVISPTQQNMLISINCLTVEDLAVINDQGIRRIGMGAVELKEKAKAWLASLSDHGSNTIKVAALETENRILKETLASLENKVEALSKMVPKNEVYVEENSPGEITADDLIDKPKRGRPKKS